VLELHIKAADDCGIRNLELYTEMGEREVSLKKWAFTQVTDERREVAFVDIDPQIFAVNATYRIWCRGEDNFPSAQVGKTALPVVLHVTDPVRSAGATDVVDDYTRVFALLQEALESQKTIQTGTAAQVKQAKRTDLIDRTRRQQVSRVHRRIENAGNLSRDLVKKGKAPVQLSVDIAAVLAGPAARVLRLFADAKGTDDMDKRQILLNETALAQVEVIRALQAILGEISRQRDADRKEDERTAEDDAEKELFARLEKLRKEVYNFQDEQKELMARLEDIDKKEPEDWTQAEEALLGDLAAKQNDMANFFKAAFNDLSKCENQDFSNSMLAEELIEMYEELVRVR